MKLYKAYLIIPFIFIFAITLYPQDKTEKKNIAVIDLESRGGLSAAEIGTLTDRLRSMLVRTNTFNVVDRGRMQNILDEQGFQMTGCTSTECAVEAGKILGVEQMLSGTIGRIGTLYTIDVILINTETSQIIKSLTRDYTGGIEGLVAEMKSIANELANIQEKKEVAATGGVNIQTDPAGIDISIDGKIVGKTPLTVFDLSTGSHALKLSKSGYATYETTINIQANQVRDIVTELQRAWMLSISSKPDGADVYINNKKVGNTPYQNSYSDDTELKIELRKENCLPWTDELTMDENQTVKAELDYTDAYTQQLAEKAREGRPEVKESGGSTWYYWVGGAVLLGAGAAVLLGGGSDTPGETVDNTTFTQPARP